VVRRARAGCLPQGAVRAVAVVMIGILGQHRPQLPAPEDEHPVQHLPPNGANPPLRIGIRPRRSYRRAQHRQSLGGQDGVECGGELRVPIADQKPGPADAIIETDEQVTGLLGHPLPDWMRGHPQHMDPSGGGLDYEQHVQPFQELHQDAPSIRQGLSQRPASTQRRARSVPSRWSWACLLVCWGSMWGTTTGTVRTAA
jgi:hypothetical protein